MVMFSIFVLLAVGVPIFVTLFVSTILYVFVSSDTSLFLSFLGRFYNSMGNFALLAIPMFVLVGEIMNEAGITSRLVLVSRVVVGSIQSGLAYINLISNALLAAIIGSSIAQTAVMSRIIVPEMEKEGYKREDAAAITCAGGLLGPIIPPSMPFVVFAVLAQVPVADMFLAGIVPGMLLFFGFVIMTAIIGFRRNYPKSKALSRKEAILAIVNSIPALLVPASIVGTIMMGWGSPTDAAAIATLIAFFVGKFLYKELSLSAIPKIFLRAGLNSSLVLILIGAAGVFGWIIIFQEIPQEIATWIVKIAGSPTQFLIIVFLFLLVIGTIIESMAAMIIAVPILLPIAQDVYGIAPIPFGVIVVLTLVLGLLTPPVGVSLHVAAGISQVSPWRLFVAVSPYITVGALVTLSLCFMPWLVDFWF